jgi:hypothetical protein
MSKVENHSSGLITRDYFYGCGAKKTIASPLSQIITMKAR